MVTEQHISYQPLRICDCCLRDSDPTDGEYREVPPQARTPWWCGDCVEQYELDFRRDAYDAAEEEADRQMDEERWGDR